jgi:hypothetical protein
MTEPELMNYELLIFDPQDQNGRKTINGLPAGFLSPNYPRLVGGDGKPPPIDLVNIVEAFHGRLDGRALCVYTGVESDGVNIVDGNPNNFLITNLEPVSKAWMDGQPFLPKCGMTKVFPGPVADLELEIYGVPVFHGSTVLDNLQLPQLPASLGTAHEEAKLLWAWNQLTKVQWLKGLTSLTRRNRQTGMSVSLTNKTIMEFTFKLLHQDFKTQEIE